MLGSIRVRFPSLVTILLLLSVSFEGIELDDVTGTLPAEMKDPVAHIDIGTELFWNSWEDEDAISSAGLTTEKEGRIGSSTVDNSPDSGTLPNGSCCDRSDGTSVLDMGTPAKPTEYPSDWFEDQPEYPWDCPEDWGLTSHDCCKVPDPEWTARASQLECSFCIWAPLPIFLGSFSWFADKMQYAVEEGAALADFASLYCSPNWSGWVIEGVPDAAWMSLINWLEVVASFVNRPTFPTILTEDSNWSTEVMWFIDSWCAWYAAKAFDTGSVAVAGSTFFFIVLCQWFLIELSVLQDPSRCDLLSQLPSVYAVYKQLAGWYVDWNTKRKVSYGHEW
jgi:hypothetical protein